MEVGRTSAKAGLGKRVSDKDSRASSVSRLPVADRRMFSYGI